jgi:hypothetical protein
VATKADVMTTLCSAFGVFTAFGAAILAFFNAGTGLEKLSNRLADREKKLLWGDTLVWLVAAVVALAVIISGAGLIASFIWLRAAANGSGHAASWAYTFAEDMFFTEAVIITVITVVAVMGTAFLVLPRAKGSARRRSRVASN